MGLELEGLGGKIVNELMESCRSSWNGWNEDQRALVAACARDAAILTVRAMKGDDVSAEKRQIDAQLSNIRVTVALSAAGAIWQIMEKLLRTAALVLLK